MHPGYMAIKFDYKGYVEYLEKQTMNKDHIERTKRMIEVMQAYVDGEAVEVMVAAGWKKVDDPQFDFYREYRIAKTPDSINWDHVAPEFKYMERRPTGDAYLYTGHPEKSNTLRSMPASIFSSYKRGTVDWKDSLVIRPGCE